MARSELLGSTDEVIEDAVGHADPVLLRALLHQLTGDAAIAAIPHELVGEDFRGPAPVIANPEHVALLRARSAEWLRSYRDAGAGETPLAEARLHRSMELALGATLGAGELEMWIEQMALDPMARGFEWGRRQPSEAQKNGFLVVVIGAGMGGLNAAIQLKRAGIPFVVLEKNAGVGGTWHENRYPGARVDSASRNYFHGFAADYPCPNAFCPQAVNEGYFNWVADHFDLRGDIILETEVMSMAWDEASKTYEVSAEGPDGARRWKANAVISCVGLLNRPNTPTIAGADSFEGEIIHTARWPQGIDLSGKQVAVIGSGASGYQMTPVLAGQVGHLTLFQRTPSWCFEVPGYLKPYPPQVNWLDRNFPFMVNFARLQASWVLNPESMLRLIEADPGYNHPHALSTSNMQALEQCVKFMRQKMPGRDDLVEKMTPRAPPLSSRPILVDTEDNIYDALMRDNVELVTEPIEAITSAGIRTGDGKDRAFDVIIYATGFKANDFLWPIDLRGRGGRSIGDLWAKDGARAYLGTMIPGFPNFFMVYGPNMNPFFNGLGLVETEEMTTRFALKCIAALILQDRRAIDVRSEAYDRFNTELDRLEATKIYADDRVTNYYKNDFGRSAVNCPFDVRLLWNWWRDPANEEGVAADADPVVRPYIGEDLMVD